MRKSPSFSNNNLEYPATHISKVDRRVIGRNS
jgi:hypothetical protein